MLIDCDRCFLTVLDVVNMTSFMGSDFSGSVVLVLRAGLIIDLFGSENCMQSNRKTSCIYYIVYALFNSAIHCEINTALL